MRLYKNTLFLMLLLSLPAGTAFAKCLEGQTTTLKRGMTVYTQLGNKVWLKPGNLVRPE